VRRRDHRRERTRSGRDERVHLKSRHTCHSHRSMPGTSLSHDQKPAHRIENSAQDLESRQMTTIKIPFSGGCACGAIRYESTAEPVLMLHCHCRDCQQSSGGPFSSFVVVLTEALKLLQGALRFHASPSEMGGQTHRGFCPDCGSPILAKPDSVPNFVAIRTASLDDPRWFNPQVDVWTSDAHAWDQMNPALPKFEKYPTQPT
jgi:hypothetical protein